MILHEFRSWYILLPLLLLLSILLILIPLLLLSNKDMSVLEYIYIFKNRHSNFKVSNTAQIKKNNHHWYFHLCCCFCCCCCCCCCCCFLLLFLLYSRLVLIVCTISRELSQVNAKINGSFGLIIIYNNLS